MKKIYYQDHPRIRGTNEIDIYKRKCKLGSPPHTRDKWKSASRTSSPEGITPAYAGQIPSFSAMVRKSEDHPRIRGTNDNRRFMTINQEGSPPHTRDKFLPLVCLLTEIRITPAYAGQIEELYGDTKDDEDHPRIRGTNCPTLFSRFVCAGSPPHTRDK